MKKSFCLKCKNTQPCDLEVVHKKNGMSQYILLLLRITQQFKIIKSRQWITAALENFIFNEKDYQQ